jgi:2-polyprenyl-3-methyl-5-hydroxy-6-metoxy-1,4-benzoquinol methylase
MSIDVEQPKENPEETQEKRFVPPLWKQRRVYASERMRADPTIESVLDIGCGEGALLQILLNDTKYSQLAGLDIDLAALNEAEYSCTPTEMDHRYPRELPVHFALYYGNLTTLDQRLQNFDCITLLEVIEHLDPPVLEQLPKVVFGSYRPRMVVVSTPNAEFNVHFPNLNYGTPLQTFRHWDHRFEWTRDEFKTWCDSVCSTYGYSYNVECVGYWSGQKDVGGCSQIAVFYRETDMEKPVILEKPFQMKYQVDYPYFKEDNFSDEEIIKVIESDYKYLITDWDRVVDSVQFSIEQLWSRLTIRQYCKYQSKMIQVLRSFPEICKLSADGESITFFKPEIPQARSPQSTSSYDDDREEEQFSDDDNWGDDYSHQKVVIDTSNNCWQ